MQYNEVNMLLASRVRQLRKEKDIKQEVMAQKLGITQQAYSQLEKGQRNFNTELITKLCAIFNVPVVEFFNFGTQQKIINSANGNSTYSYVNNDSQIINELLKSKDEVIQTLKELLEKYKLKEKK
ncbi:MAG: hypothetical protein OHK0036_20690 [Bacteroidia bacterium]